MARLGKAHVEALLDHYDAAPIVALNTALRIALDSPTLEWAALVGLADLSENRREGLLRGDPAVLDGLAVELNEVRVVAARTLQSHPAREGP